MVPIVPSGAVELTLFREPSGPMPEAERKGVGRDVQTDGKSGHLEVSKCFPD